MRGVRETQLGKRPDRTEFVRVGRPGALELAWEVAIQAAVERYPELPLPAPVRFMVAERGGLAIGAWTASADASGRAFPCVRALRIGAALRAVPWSVLPVHLAPWLEGAPAPHESRVLLDLHRAMQSADGFVTRSFPGAHASAYAACTFVRALEQPVIIELPAGDELALFAWLELTRLRHPAPPRCLVWMPQRAWLSVHVEPALVLAQLWQHERTHERRWPLCTDDLDAHASALLQLGRDGAERLERAGPQAVASMFAERDHG